MEKTGNLAIASKGVKPTKSPTIEELARELEALKKKDTERETINNKLLKSNMQMGQQLSMIRELLSVLFAIDETILKSPKVESILVPLTLVARQHFINDTDEGDDEFYEKKATVLAQRARNMGLIQKIGKFNCIMRQHVEEVINYKPRKRDTVKGKK